MEQLSDEVKDLREWQAKLIAAQRKAARWLLLALVLFAAGIVVALWRIDNLVEAQQRAIVAQNNFDRKLLIDQFQIDVARWETCQSRNEVQKQTLRQDEEQSAALIRAHEQDGDVAVTKFWRKYFAEKPKLPPCGKKPTMENLPTNVP